MRSDLLAAGLLAAALVLAPATADAFCRTTTVAVPAGFDASVSGCFTEGVLLYHQSQCVPYHLLAQESAVLPRAALSDAFAHAFNAWTSPNPTCSPGISGIELAPSTASKIVDYVAGQRGDNVFGVVQGAWPHAGGSDTLSLATLTFNADTGEIYDADMEIREDLKWSISGTPAADTYDLQAVLTHEVGHVLGLAHSENSGAVMAPTYSAGSVTQRTLVADDEQAICAVYPDRQTRATSAGVVASTPCDLSPGATTGSTCGDPTITHGCSAGARGPSRDGAFLAALGILGTLAWRIRRRKRVTVAS